MLFCFACILFYCLFSSAFAYTHDSDTDSNSGSSSSSGSMGNSQRKLNGETMTAYVRGKRGFEFRDDLPEPKAPTKDKVVLKVSTAAINPVDYKLINSERGSLATLSVSTCVELWELLGTNLRSKLATKCTEGQKDPLLKKPSRRAQCCPWLPQI